MARVLNRIKATTRTQDTPKCINGNFQNIIIRLLSNQQVYLNTKIDTNIFQMHRLLLRVKEGGGRDGGRVWGTIEKEKIRRDRGCE